MTFRPISPDDLDHICRPRYETFKAAGWPEEILLPSPNRSAIGLRRDSGTADGDRLPPHPAHPLDSRRRQVLNKKGSVSGAAQYQKRAPSPEPLNVVDRLRALRGAALTSSFLRRPSSSGQLSFWLPSYILRIEIRDFEKSRA
jgi:hypothetical protein